MGTAASWQELDPEDGWRIHLFVLDEAVLVLLDGIDSLRCEPGYPGGL